MGLGLSYLDADNNLNAAKLLVIHLIVLADLQNYNLPLASSKSYH